VVAVLGSANRDESVLRDPETLDLARDPNPHVAFGQGRHFCLGASLARLEAQIALTTLFARFPGLGLTQPAESLRWRRLLPLRGLAELPVAGHRGDAV
jgi:cytochrome P450 PksS